MNKSLGLYLHVPFCRSKCTYCDFHSAVAKPEVQGAYVDALIALADSMRPQAADYAVDTVYFGGGTPSVLAAEAFSRLMAAVRRYPLVPHAEITAEANPAPLSPDLLRVWRAEGVNRISLGMQSAVDEELKRIGRRHSRDDLQTAVAAARAVGIENISLDLMLGLPGQTLASMHTSLSAALALSPTHLSVYCLKLEEGTALERMVESGKVTLPDDDAVAEMYLDCAARLVREGFEHYEISNFALPGCRSRHNMRYWQRKEYLGLGPAAHSFFGGERFFFPADTPGFIAAASENRLCRVVDDPADPIEETLMLSLRLSDGLDLAAFAALTDAETAARIEKVLERFVPTGHVCKSAAGYALTAEGMLVSNTVLTELLLALEA